MIRKINNIYGKDFWYDSPNSTTSLIVNGIKNG